MKTTLVLCTILGLISHAEFVRVNSRQFTTTYNSATTRLQQISEIVANTVRASIPLLTSLSTDLQARRTSVIESADLQIDRSHQILETRVRAIKNQALAQGIDITSCARSLEYELTILPRYIKNEIVRCLDVGVEVAQKVTDESVQVVQNAEHVPLRFTVRLEQCRIIGLESCVESIFEDIERELVNLPARAAEDTLMTRQAVRILDADLRTCSTDRLDYVENIGNEIVENIRRCAQ